MTTFSEMTGDYRLDIARTTLGFVARHTMSSRVAGHFDEFEGSVRLDGGEPSQSSVRFTVKAASIDTGNARRDDQLRGAFLDAEAHPAITFASTGIRHLGGTRFEVAGDLTVRGVTNPVRGIVVELVDIAANRVAFAGSVTIDRHRWGVNQNFATRLMVSSKVTLRFSVEVTAGR
ncbi:polyisoprenoid-binding protein [Amycolatopsis thailandensis]|uniref:Polyisoprenoid-binding protein n=1 Tax=Amycolatopsis thailandensis TaxID=589330 RepID=A0A229SFB7_9PSEU|nr:YceI family protein [Amycolatopsis thailandensis]OXM57613.1 polyisoprenoid-binding protein [Amycolatopsis thailandensis]